MVNKADHEGARTTARELKAMLMLGGSGSSRRRSDSDMMRGHDAWQTPVLSTIAEDGSGVADLAATLQQHYGSLVATDALAERRVRRVVAAVEAIVAEQFRRELTGPAGRAELARVAESVIRGSGNTYAAASAVTKWLRGQ